jgi:quercetin dioxygenase-like cupin family protein
MHVHEGDAQLFYVMSGRLTFDTGDDRFTLSAGEAVLFEPGEQHATANDGTTSSSSLVVTVERTPVHRS